jgi:hypothetical protein
MHYLHRILRPVHAQDNDGLPIFAPAQERVEIEDIYLGRVEWFKDSAHAAGVVRDLHRDDFVDMGFIAVALEDISCFNGVVGDEPDRADLGGVGHGDGPYVYAFIAQAFADAQEGAGHVVQCYRYLFYHTTNPLNPPIFRSSCRGE